MEWQGNGQNIELCIHLDGIVLPHGKETEPDGRINDTSNANPSRIEEHRYQLDPDGQAPWQTQNPGRQTLLVEYSPCNQAPGIQLDTHTGSHQPSNKGVLIGDEDVEQSGDMVLNDRGRTLDTLGNDPDPDQIGQKVQCRELEEEIEPLASPRAGNDIADTGIGCRCFGGLVAVMAAAFRRKRKAGKQYIPVPVHPIQDAYRHQDDEVEEIVDVSRPVLVIFDRAGQDRVMRTARIDPVVLLDQYRINQILPSAGRWRRP